SLVQRRVEYVLVEQPLQERRQQQRWQVEVIDGVRPLIAPAASRKRIPYAQGGEGIAHHRPSHRHGDPPLVNLRNDHTVRDASMAVGEAAYTTCGRAPTAVRGAKRGLRGTCQRIRGGDGERKCKSPMVTSLQCHGPQEGRKQAWYRASSGSAPSSIL